MVPPSIGGSSIGAWLCIAEQGGLGAVSSPEINPAPPVWELLEEDPSRSLLLLG